MPVSFAGATERLHVLIGIVTVLQLITALALIFLVLLHSGRGGGMSDMFGGGMGGGQLTGSTVVERNLDRLTVAVAILFAITTLSLTWLLAGQG
ncbi:MAG TPA: preprotein translocase subunit SecG [Actinobacteria bacterium]|nr:preprotein translocase subunit SecG [Actinomycetota bacterium]